MSRSLSSHAVAGTVVGCALLLAGCPAPQRADLEPDDVDRQRAEQVQSDPWVAPDERSQVGQLPGSNGWVDRLVAARTDVVAGQEQDVLRAETERAVAAGWELVAAVCADGQGPRVELARGSSLDDDARAVVTTRDVSLTEDELRYEVRVRAYVPHHVDRGWPRPAVLDIGDSCLSDASAPDVDVEDVSAGERFSGS
jgi:hypothetical protein